MESFSDIANLLIARITEVGKTVNGLPGTVAFGLGLFTWFLAEQILRRLISGLRWIILIGALAGLGLTAPYMLSLIFDASEKAPITQPES